MRCSAKQEGVVPMVGQQEDDLSFATLKVNSAYEAVSNQICIVFQLKQRGLDIVEAEKYLENLCRELRTWQEYRAIISYRNGLRTSLLEHA